jgi:hypothetical protein
MTNHYLWARITGPDPDLRAADADRERVGERLRRSHAEGRLDMTEFQERLERCYESKTLGELRELVRDLPRPDESQERPTASLLSSWRSRLTPLTTLLIVLIVTSALTGHHHVAWLWIPLWFLIWRMWWWPRRRRWAGSRRGSEDWL